MKIFLLLYFVVYIFTAFLARSYLVWKKTGINPYIAPKSDNAHDFVLKLFRVIIVLCFLVLVSYCFADDSYKVFIPIPWVEFSFFKIIGVILLLFSLIWTVIAQANMGMSWRIGIDSEHKTNLVQKGVFKFSRNPIFLGMRLTLLAFFILIPNAVTLVILVLGDVLIQIQVRLEEEFLEKVHGEEYRVYKSKVRRW